MKNAIFILFFMLAFLGKCHSVSGPRSYNAIFNFGDSLSDTGNYLAIHSPNLNVIDKFPYGETFFGKPTGRFCNGRIILDFIAETYRLPYVPSYMDVISRKVKNIRQGVNFAVAGATALDAEFIVSKRAGKPIATIESLSVQLGWFKKLKPLLCSNEYVCARLFKKSLFFVGEIGGNDIGFLGLNSTARETIPLIVEAIKNATITLIKEGAVHLVVPGNLPVGCTAGFMPIRNDMTEKEFDSRGCFKPFNALAEYQNKEIKLGLSKLKRKYPHVKITYADYYGAAKQFYDAPKKYGFSQIFRPCYEAAGTVNATLCLNPANFSNWDGHHYTEAANRIIAQGLIEGPFSHPPLKRPHKDSLVLI